MSVRKHFILFVVFCGILAFSCHSAAIYGHENGKDLIRFHVIANSDSTFDQSVKLAVRDGVIEEVNTILNEASSKQEAQMLLAEHKDEIIKKANAVLKQHHCDYGADAVLGTSSFPTKTYGDLTLPAGEYDAFRIILGEGKGKNWWCVLYPPLCFVDIKDDTAVAVTTTTEIPADKEDAFAVNGELFQVKLRSKFLEWWYR